MKVRFTIPLLLSIVAGCLVPHYGIEHTEAGAGGDTNVGGSLGAAATAGAMAGTGATSTGNRDCTTDEKRCGGMCVKLDDVEYGCTPTSCNKSACPAPGTGTLTCEGGACVIGGCGAGTKKCDGKCVSINDPTYGCSETACDPSVCPDPNMGTLVCNGTTCEVGECGVTTKNCASKCVPLDENNGCADLASCTACQSFQRCPAVTPGPCSCTPDDVEACKGIDCGEVTNNCQMKVECYNRCKRADLCMGNTCADCNMVEDCPVYGCSKVACTNHECKYSLPPAGTKCVGGTCSKTNPGVCDRPSIDAGGVSIDATEVTIGQYDLFVKAKAGDTSGQPSHCSWNQSYEPNLYADGYVSANIAVYEFPQVGVDWCDAYAYCKWAKRRLCGKIGGTSNAPADSADATKSQWFHACTGPNNYVYPYGNDYVEGACNGGFVMEAEEPVATFPGCVGGYPGLYDMSGSAAEWQDSCSGISGASDLCLAQGGEEFMSYAPSLRCVQQVEAARNETRFGFRCCL